MTERVSTSRRSRDALGYISELHGQLAGRLVGLVAAGVVAGVAEALSLLALVRAAIGIASDSGSGSGPLLPGLPGQLSPGAALVVSLSCALVAAVLHVLLSGATVRLGERVALAGRNRLIDAFVAAQWSHVARLSAGTFQQALTSFADKSGRAAVQLASALSAGVIALSLAAVAVWVSPLASLLVLVFTVLVYLLVRRQVGSAFQRSDSTIGQELDLAQAASETSSLGLEYRAAGVQEQQAERLRSTAFRHASRLTQLRSRTLAVGFLSRDLVMISLIGVVSVLYFAFDVDASMAASVLVVVRMLGYLQQAFRASHDGLQELAGAAALRDLIDELERQRQPGGSVAIADLRSVALVGVSYSYDGVRRALDDVTLELPVNTTIGVVGPSGAGKSTLAEVLLGLRAPETGRVVVNGLDLADVDRAAWAKLVAFVPQHQQFAKMSVGENIRFLRPWISDADVADAARRAHVLDEIERLPDGFDHRLASGTGGLSGGQRQRIAIARALAGRPSLLVLDEPTSALDAVTEQRFRQTLDDLHGTVTIVVIAHRPATLEGCDVVISLAGGRVALVDRMV